MLLYGRVFAHSALQGARQLSLWTARAPNRPLLPEAALAVKVPARKIPLYPECSGSKVRSVLSVPAVTLAGALIGRDAEKAVLSNLVQEVASGQGGLLLIEGEPGIGKSALVRAATAEAADAGCEVFWGAGDELGQALPLLPLLEGLRVREESASPRRNTILRLLRGELAADRGTDVSAALAEQLLALVAEQCATQPDDAGHRRSPVGGPGQRRAVGPAGPAGAAGAAAAGRDDAAGAAARRPAGAAANGRRGRPGSSSLGSLRLPSPSWSRSSRAARPTRAIDAPGP